MKRRRTNFINPYLGDTLEYERGAQVFRDGSRAVAERERDSFAQTLSEYQQSTGLRYIRREE